MKATQLTQGEDRRIMYIESKGAPIDGAQARIGWVTFSKTGRTVYYRGRSLKAIGGRGVSGNFIDEANGEEFWVSGVKKRGSNAHPTARTSVQVDDDAKSEYERYRETPNKSLERSRER